MTTHDPLRHIEYLRQCLRQDKAPIAFFLSAGCGLAVRVDDGSGGTRPLVPDIAGMTGHVRDEIAGSAAKDALERLEATIPAIATPNVEDLLSRIRTLAVVADAGPVHGLSNADLEELDATISSGVADLAGVSLPPDGTPHRALAAWAGAIMRAQPVELFTTNYDLLFEQALEELVVPYFDGFVGARRPFFDIASDEGDLPSRWLRLWKLHGSVNWRVVDGAITRTSHLVPSPPALIHPSHLKYDESRRMPYLAMVDRLRSFLRERRASLIICGYSFGDQHLNDVIRQGLEANPTAAAFGLLYGTLDAYEAAEALARARPNLTLLAADAGVVGTTRAPWEGNADDDLMPLGDFGKLGELLEALVGELPVQFIDG